MAQEMAVTKKNQVVSKGHKRSKVVIEANYAIDLKHSFAHWATPLSGSEVRDWIDDLNPSRMFLG